MWRAITTAAVLALCVGCAGDGGSASPAGASAAPEAEAAPSATPAPETTQPTGVFRWRSEIVRVVPRDTSTDVGPRRHRGSWRFEPGECDDAGCTGTVVSTSGRTLEWQWDGTRLGLSTRSEPQRQDCGGGTSARFVLAIRVRDVEITARTDEGRPTAFTSIHEQRTRVLDNDGCVIDPKSLKLLVGRTTASQ